jgi:hypothetical protein
MMKFISIVISLWILLTINSIAQIQFKPVEYRYLNGETGLREYLTKNAVFPANSLINGTIGFSLSSITINPKGAIADIKIINPIDQFIDKEVTRVLRSSAQFWLKCDTLIKSQTFYIQIAFVISTLKSYSMVTSQVSSPFFIDPVVISAVMITYGGSVMDQTNELLGIKCSVLLSSKQYEESLAYIDELIRRNPFNREFYQFRIFIYRNMGRSDLIEKDIERMTNFAEGISLDEILYKYQESP